MRLLIIRHIWLDRVRLLHEEAGHSLSIRPWLLYLNRLSKLTKRIVYDALVHLMVVVVILNSRRFGRALTFPLLILWISFSSLAVATLVVISIEFSLLELFIVLTRLILNADWMNIECNPWFDFWARILHLLASSDLHDSILIILRIDCVESVRHQLLRYVVSLLFWVTLSCWQKLTLKRQVLTAKRVFTRPTLVIGVCLDHLIIPRQINNLLKNTPIVIVLFRGLTLARSQLICSWCDTLLRSALCFYNRSNWWSTLEKHRLCSHYSSCSLCLGLTCSHVFLSCQLYIPIEVSSYNPYNSSSFLKASWMTSFIAEILEASRSRSPLNTQGKTYSIFCSVCWLYLVRNRLGAV